MWDRTATPDGLMRFELQLRPDGLPATVELRGTGHMAMTYTWS